MSSLFNKALNYLNSAPEQGNTNEFVGRTVAVNARSYRIVCQLAEGGFAYVFLAQDVSSGRLVALKRLMIPDREQLQLVKQEVAVMQLCRECPAVVEYIDSAMISARDTGHKNGEMLIVMEMCPGRLWEVLSARARGFEPHDVIRIFEPIVSAVAFLHSQSPPIIHRDLKIENILISADRKAKLCDFGSCTTEVMRPETTAQIGNAEDEIQRNTTPQYRAPEMWDLYSRIPIDEKSDIWALGCILYKLCHYRSPFDDGSKMAICSADLRLPSSGQNTMFHDLLRVLLSKDPKNRPTAFEVLSELERIKSSLGPAPRGGEDVLAVPMPEVSGPGAGAADSLSGAKAQVQQKLMGVYRNVKSAIDQNMAGQQQQQNVSRGPPPPPPRGAGREEQGEMEWSYITPRLVGMAVPNQGSVSQMHSFVETSHRNKYFVFNLSDLVYSESMFQNRVRHVRYPKKGCLGLADLYELCESMHAWLLADRDNVAVVHCNNGSERTGAVLTAYMVYCGLFTEASHALAHFYIKRRLPITPKPGAVRLATHIRQIVTQERLPHGKPISIRRITIPSLPVFESQPQPPFPIVATGGKTVFTGKDRPPQRKNNSMYMDVHQEATEDFLVLVALPKDNKVLQLCQVQLYPGYLGSGTQRYSLNDMDKPNKSLTNDFYLELEIDVLEPTGARPPEPWANQAGGQPNALLTCFFNDSEGRGLTQKYERDVAAKLGESTPDTSAAPPRPARPPSSSSIGSASKRAGSAESGPDTSREPAPALIDFGDFTEGASPPRQESAGGWDSEPATSMGQTPSATLEDDLLGFTASPASQVPTPARPTPPPATEDLFANLLDTSSTPTQSAGASSAGNNDWFDIDDGVGQPIQKSNSGVGTPRRESPTDAPQPRSSGLDFTSSPGNSMGAGFINPPSSSNSLPQPRAKPSTPDDPFQDLLGGLAGSPSTPLTATGTSPGGMGATPRPSNPIGASPMGGGSAYGQPNYRVNTTFLNQPSDASPRPTKANQKSDPFGDLSGLGAPKTAMGAASPLGSPRHQSPNLNTANRPGQPTPHPPQWTNPNAPPTYGSSPAYGQAGGWQGMQQQGGANWQQQRAANQQRAQEQMAKAQQQRLQQQQQQQQMKTQQQWQKKQPMGGSSPMAAHSKSGGSGSMGGFADLLTEHNFVPTQKDKGPVSLNSLKNETLLADDTDGSMALKIKVNTWKEGKKGNIRALLGSLQDILWEDSGWEEVPMSQLLKATQVKKAYMKACLIVHPDKITGTEHEAMANMVFDELNKAYTAFKDQGMPSLG